MPNVIDLMQSLRTTFRRPANSAAAAFVLMATAICLSVATSVDWQMRQAERSRYQGAIAGSHSGDGSRPAVLQASSAFSLAPAAQAYPREIAGLRYAIGDRLKITFYEQLAAESGSSGRSSGRSLIERTELSGEYVVQLNGDVHIQILGAVQVGQRTPAEAEAALVKQAASVIGDNLKVSLVVAEREPIYVMGALPRAGVFKFVPGMVLAQVVTLAGGEAGGAENWQQIDIAREQERMSKSLERMKRQLTVLDVLAAEKRGDTPTASDRLREIAGASAVELVAAAKEARDLELSRQALQTRSLEKLIAATRADLAATRARLDQVSAIVAERSKRRDELASRVTRGVSTESIMVQARNELVEIQTRWHELRAVAARGEMRLLELERDRDQALLNAQIDLDQQMRSARQSIAEEEVMISTIGQVLLKIRPASVASSAGPHDVAYRLVRRTLNGPVQLAAEMMTALEPGDVVQVLAGDQYNTALARLPGTAAR